MSVAEGWDAGEHGAALVAAVTRAMNEERMKAHGRGDVATSADLARAVLRSPALRDANRKILDVMMAEYEPKIAAPLPQRHP